MKNTLKYIIIFWFAAISQKAAAQGIINITFQNGVVVNNVWTVDIYAGADVSYAAPTSNDWSFITLRADIAVPANVTISSTSNSANSTYMDATGMTSSNTGPYTSAANTVKLVVQMSRNSQTELTSTPVRLGTLTVTFTGGTVTGDVIATPRQDYTTSSGSKWTNTAQTGVAQQIAQPNTFTLPITLLSFDAAKAGASVKLNWLVTSEINAMGYGVERSGNGSSFTEIDHIAATGISNYNSIDASPLSGVNYYRLKMIDIDGKFKYSAVRTVLFDGTTVLFDIYPNPVVTSKLYLHLQQNNYTGKAQAIITDIAGRSIQSSTINLVKGNNQLPITVKSLTSGTYFVTIYDANGTSITETKKLVKQ